MRHLTENSNDFRRLTFELSARSHKHLTKPTNVHPNLNYRGEYCATSNDKIFTRSFLVRLFRQPRLSALFYFCHRATVASLKRYFRVILFGKFSILSLASCFPLLFLMCFRTLFAFCFSPFGSVCCFSEKRKAKERSRALPFKVFFPLRFYSHFYFFIFTAGVYMKWHGRNI